MLLQALLFHALLLLLLQLFLLLQSHQFLLLLELLLLPLLLDLLMRLLGRLRLRLRLSLLAQSKHRWAGHGWTSRGGIIPLMHACMGQSIQRLLGRRYIHAMLMRHRSRRSHSWLLP